MAKEGTRPQAMTPQTIDDVETINMDATNGMWADHLPSPEGDLLSSPSHLKNMMVRRMLEPTTVSLGKARLTFVTEKSRDEERCSSCRIT
jgi:hypothetical protein